MKKFEATGGKNKGIHYTKFIEKVSGDESMIKSEAVKNDHNKKRQ